MVAPSTSCASLILLVMEKHRDIAILEDDGRVCAGITTIFMLQGLDHRNRRYSCRCFTRIGVSYVLDATS
jgi:hypothetical protein